MSTIWWWTKRFLVGLGMVICIIVPIGLIVGGLGLLFQTFGVDWLLWLLVGLLGVGCILALWALGDNIIDDYEDSPNTIIEHPMGGTWDLSPRPSTEELEALEEEIGDGGARV